LEQLCRALCQFHLPPLPRRARPAKEHLEEWKKGRDLSLEQQAQHVTSFQEQAQQLMEGLSDMQTLLEEKEFQLWEKEGLLEYQEERLMNSEDLELEMANYINEMAQALVAKNSTLPAGLEEKPYYGSQLANADDDPGAGNEYGERRGKLRHRRRQLRAALLAPALEGDGAVEKGDTRKQLVSAGGRAVAREPLVGAKQAPRPKAQPKVQPKALSARPESLAEHLAHAGN